MKKTFLYLWIVLAGLVVLPSCDKDEPDQNNSIFDTNSPYRNSFDTWLLDNFILPYNIKILYLLKDIETDFNYNVVPTEIHKAKQMAFLLKYLWLEAYESVALTGVHFMRETAPRVFVFLGTVEYNLSGVARAGVAEGAMQVILANLNNLDAYNIANQQFFKTIHHEYAHILHQKKYYPIEFEQITPTTYLHTTWSTARTVLVAAQQGYVTQYAGKMPHEDFAETMSCYLTWSNADWEAKLVQAGTTGAPLILAKLDIIKTYMKGTWGVDLDMLKDEVQRRVNEIQYMDLINLGF